MARCVAPGPAAPTPSVEWTRLPKDRPTPSVKWTVLLSPFDHGVTIERMQSFLHSRRKNRGQAMAEYSMINFVLVMGLVVGLGYPFIPGKVPQTSHNGGGATPHLNVIEYMLEGIQTHYTSITFVLNLPFP